MSAIDGTELDGYEALVSELRATAPVAPERLRERVLEGAPAPRRRRSKRRRLALVVVPAAVVLAVGAAVVHGFVGSRTNGRRHGRVATATEASRSTRRRLTVAPWNSAQAPAASLKAAAPAPSVASSRLQHTDASIQVRVPDTDSLGEATTKATRIATSLGGYAQSVDYQTPQDGGGVSIIELRVPSQNVKAALSRLAGLGTLVSQQLSVERSRARGCQNAVGADHAASPPRRGVARGAARAPRCPRRSGCCFRSGSPRVEACTRPADQRPQGHDSAGATARISLVIGTERGDRARAEAARPPGPDAALGRRVPRASRGSIALYALIVVQPAGAGSHSLVWGVGGGGRSTGSSRPDES